MTSEPFQMAMIHRTFRIEFGNIPALINDVAPGDVKRSRTVGAYLGNMLSVLHHHHAAEDDFLWPTLHSRSGLGDDVADRARTEHLAIADVMKDIESIRPSWQRTADSRHGTVLADRVDALSGIAAGHFRDEERDLVPLVGEHLSAAEWQTFIDRGAAYVKPANLWFALAYGGILLSQATPEEGRRFMAAVPVPLRIVLKLAGGRAYRSHRTALYGPGA
ncbi:hemerythrin domain-containing protein [Mycobacterium sp. NPDC050551]|uniref:hemerythrin domain-containing protein n=1 Tax=Mycobacterium sp. NPDC050551 TaxID=3155407 RepID=UPI0034254789